LEVKIVTQNIFSIDNPENYACVIRKYVVGQSVMHIEVVSNFKPPNIFYLVFYPVEYFCGPITWQGVNFEIASSEACLKVISQLERYDNIPDEKLMEDPYSLKLYQVKTDRNTIQILA